LDQGSFSLNDYASAQLRRQLSGTDLVAYGMTYIALVAPLSTMGLVWVASGGQIALAYLIGLVCISFTGLSYATMARRVPQAGSAYAYATHALGARAGFLAGWLLLLDYLLIPALVFVMMSIGMDTVAPGLGRQTWLGILVLTTLGINWFGIKVTTRASLISVALQALFLLVFVVMCWRALAAGAGQGALTLKPLFDPAALDWEKVLAGAGICMLSFLGFDAISTLTEEVRADSPQQS
jgi:amino acid transporter